jgi:DNA repair photolyase
VLRWRTVEDDPQGTLFRDEELVDRHVGRGEFRGLEFLHVRARTVINQVPGASRMPFSHTINAYRGCSHACVYCLVGDTGVLMADGTVRPIRDLRPGDEIVGTRRQGQDRRFVSGTVIDHFETRREAYRVTLADGTELVASGDHRFLTGGGWKHVTGTEHGHQRRPHLAVDDELLGMGTLALAPAVDGDHRRDNPDLRVKAVEPLDVVVPMYDITTTTGDFIANGVISHNCFARPTHDYLGLGIGEDFDRKIVVKVNAVERVRSELASPRWGGHAIAMGTNTDPYQRAEGKYHLTQGILGALADAANPFSILTKSTLILRDLDLLVAAAGRTEVRTSFSIGTLDPDVWRLTEPGTPHPRRRVEAVARLNEAGIPCGVLVAPVLPGLSDHDDQLAEVAEACVDAGATSVSAMYLHLRPGVREHWFDWMGRALPDRVAEYEARYAGRAYLGSRQQQELAARVDRMVAVARHRRQRR